MTRVNIRKAKLSDVVRVGGVLLVDGARYIGWTGWVGRRAIATGGVAIREDGVATGVFGCAPDYRTALGVNLHRRAVRLLRRLRRAGVREIVAVCDPSIARASVWLERLGFTLRGDDVDGDPVFVWRGV